MLGSTKVCNEGGHYLAKLATLKRGAAANNAENWVNNCFYSRLRGKQQ
jgi:hypothetical protein